MKKLTTLFSLIIFVLLLSVVETAVAQDEPPPPLPPIAPPIWNMDGLRIDYQRVNVTIEDQIATTHIDQLFVNENEWMLEGTYLFPLPAGATVSQLTMWVDGQAIEAKILPKEEARQIYDAIVRQLRDPALLEYIGTQAIQANVFPIPAGDERRIEIEYSQILPASDGLLHYIYPQSTKLYTNTPLDNQSIRVTVQSNEAIRAIYSPSHRVATDRDGEFRAVVGYEAENVTPDNDFELYYSVSPEDIGLNLLSYKESGEDGFFLLLVAPSVVVDEVIAKDVILVVDTSGSMEGEKMAQAKEAAAYVIDHLNPADRFNIIAFSTGARTYQNELVRAANAGNYASFINSMEAIGGTNISQALLEAVGQADTERPTTILFLTDGLATEGIVDTPLLLDNVQAATADNVRIFVFGVGDDVDPILLDSLAQNHRGTTTYVRPGQAIDEIVSTFYAKVSAPVLANISLDFDDIIVEQQYPTTLPDLFAGTQLVLTGRYRNGGPATITLRGTVNGQEQLFSYADNSFRRNGGDEFIPRLWATRAIGHLLTQIRLHGDDPELVQSVVNLSIRYGIITPYTSYLIEEDDIFTQSGRQSIMEDEVVVTEGVMESREMVEEAAASADMAAAEAPMAFPTVTVSQGGTADNDTAVSPNVNEIVKLVGSKTFLLRDGVWIDTAYDADNMTPQAVTFASDTYFTLLDTAPSLGQFLALGPRVLVVYQGQAYETVDEGGSPDIVLPDPLGVDTKANGTPDENTALPTNDPQPDVVSDDINETENQAEPLDTGFCGGVLMIPMLLGLVWSVGRYGRRRN